MSEAAPSRTTDHNCDCRHRLDAFGSAECLIVYHGAQGAPDHQNGGKSGICMTTSFETSQSASQTVPGYRKYDLHAVQMMGANIELLKYRLYEDGRFFGSRSLTVLTAKPARTSARSELQCR
jgi:hypothetical protein